MKQRLVPSRSLYSVVACIACNIGFRSVQVLVCRSATHTCKYMHGYTPWAVLSGLAVREEQNHLLQTRTFGLSVQ